MSRPWHVWAALAALAGADPAQAQVLPAPPAPGLPAPASPATAMRGGPAGPLTFRGESRVRFVAADNAPAQGLYRGILGAEVRATPDLRAYVELGTAQAAGRPGPVGANFQNDVALQQLYLDVRRRVGPLLVGGMVGRQEYADGPRQLLSVGDGPNLHRTWNGVRLYAQGNGAWLGAFDLRGTRLDRGAFDDAINPGERLAGLQGGLDLASGEGRALALEPFVLRSANEAFGARGRTGLDDRLSYGARLRGARGALGFDWVVARQAGRSLDRDVDAWGLFASQAVTLGGLAWRPRLGLRVDLASGGAQGPRPVAGFNPLYPSSGAVSEGLFLSSSNMLLAAPSLALAPTPATGLAIEYGLARRLTEGDAAYAGLMRAYPGTERVPGHELGGLLRVTGSWSPSATLTLGATFEHLAAGDVLRRAGLPSGSYGHVTTTIRY